MKLKRNSKTQPHLQVEPTQEGNARLKIAREIGHYCSGHWKALASAVAAISAGFYFIQSRPLRQKAHVKK